MILYLYALSCVLRSLNVSNCLLELLCHFLLFRLVRLLLGVFAHIAVIIRLHRAAIRRSLVAFGARRFTEISQKVLKLLLIFIFENLMRVFVVCLREAGNGILVEWSHLGVRDMDVVTTAFLRSLGA